MTDVEARAERIHFGFHRVDGCDHLPLLSRHPLGPTHRFGSHRDFIAEKNRGIHQSVSKRLTTQRGPFRRARRGKESGRSRKLIEIFADHRRIEERRSIVHHQRRNLGQRIAARELCIARDRRHRRRLLDDSIAKTQLGDQHRCLAAKRRGGGDVKFHHRDHPWNQPLSVAQRIMAGDPAAADRDLRAITMEGSRVRSPHL